MYLWHRIFSHFFSFVNGTSDTGTTRGIGVILSSAKNLETLRFYEKKHGAFVRFCQ